jgi:hypothetical protein
MKLLLAFTFACSGLWAQSPVCPSFGPTLPYAMQNETSTGTTLYKLADQNTSNQAIISNHNNSDGAIGIVVANAGTSGSACLAFAGPSPIVVDGTTTANHWLLRSLTVDGDGHDSGTVCTADPPSTAEIIGCVTIASTGAASTSVVTIKAGFLKTGLSNPMTTSGDIIYGGASGAPTRLPTGTAKQIFVAGAPPIYEDFPEHLIVPSANCNNVTAGAGWSIPATNAPTVACRAGTNNLGGVLQWANNNTTTNAQFSIQLPGDWDTATQPWINIYYGSGANTSGTVKWTFSSACTKADGSVTDDPGFNAESASTGKTMAVANREWAESIEFTGMTSGNNCIAGSWVLIKVTSGNGTATGTVNVEGVIITIPRLPVPQAN